MAVAPSSILLPHWALVALVAALAFGGLRRGWPREAMSLVALLAARALSHASPDRVRAGVDGLWRAAGELAVKVSEQSGQPLPPTVPAPLDLTSPDAQTLAVFTVACWLVSVPVARLLFPDRPRGLASLLGGLLGACNGVLLALALVPLLPNEGLAALPEQWLLAASGPWLEQHFPPLAVGGSLVVVVVALLSGALPARSRQRHRRSRP